MLVVVLVVVLIVVLVVVVLVVLVVVVVAAGDDETELDDVLDSVVNDWPGTTLPIRIAALTRALRPANCAPAFRKQTPGGGLVFSAPP